MIYPADKHRSKSRNNKYKRCIQILAYNNTSFLLTESSYSRDYQIGDDSKEEESNKDIAYTGSEIYGWGENENNLLLSSKDRRSRPKKLPVKNIEVMRIDVQHGHFIGYAVDNDIKSDLDDEEEEMSECSEEAGDTVHNLETVVPGSGATKVAAPIGAMSKGRRSSDAKSVMSYKSKTSSRSRRSDMKGNMEFKQLSIFYNMIDDVQERLKRIDAKLRKKTNRITNYNVEYKPEVGVENENDEKKQEDALNDRDDSDHENVPETNEDYAGRLVLIALKKRKENAFTEMLKEFVKYLHINLKDDNEQVSVYKELQAAMEAVNMRKNLVNGLPVKMKGKALSIIHLAKEAILLRRMNFIGLKMRIYMERQKAINAIEFLRKIRSGKANEVIRKSDFK